MIEWTMSLSSLAVFAGYLTLAYAHARILKTSRQKHSHSISLLWTSALISYFSVGSIMGLRAMELVTGEPFWGFPQLLFLWPVAAFSVLSMAAIFYSEIRDIERYEGGSSVEIRIREAMENARRGATRGGRRSDGTA
jgi:hypothetical protein